MPLPRSVARVNRAVSNRILGPLAKHLPGFGVIEHIGRKSGRPYANPVNVFRTDTGYVMALTYGPEADWVRNVLAAGGATLTTRGRTIRLTQPRLYHDEQHRAMPAMVRFILGRIDASDFLELRTDDGANSTNQPVGADAAISPQATTSSSAGPR